SHTEKPTRREALEYYRRLHQHWDLKVHFYEEVLQMERSEADYYNIVTNKANYKTTAVALATGYYDTPNFLNVQGEDLPKVRHYYDNVHPYIGQEVLVIGAKNSAAQVALELWQKGAKVTMAVRGDAISPKVKYWIKPNLENRIKEGAIPAYFNTTVQEILPDRVVLNTPNGVKTIKNDFVLAMTGYRPNFDFLRKVGVQIPNDEGQIPVHNETTLETNLPNVYLAGVICAGMRTSKLFIENTRDHGKVIVDQIRQLEATDLVIRH
ncbi:MAG: YpdA family putative bacillithiol disulfide reductase, partial [Bacteroidota bacterium]